MPVMDLIRDNPVLVKHIRARMRTQHMVPAVIITLVVTGGMALLGLMSNLPNNDKGLWIIGVSLLLIMQCLLLPLGGGGQVGNAVGQARESGMMDFHRISPQSSAALALGFLLGAPIREYILFCCTLPGYAVLLAAMPNDLLLQGDIRVDYLWLLPLVIVFLSLAYHLIGILAGLTLTGQQRRSAGVMVVFMMIIVNGLLWAFPPLSYLSLVPTIYMAFGGSPNEFAFTINFFGLMAPAWLLSVLHLGTFIGFLWCAVVQKIAYEFSFAFTRPLGLLFLGAVGVLAVGDLGVNNFSPGYDPNRNLPFILYQVMFFALVLVAVTTPPEGRFVKAVRSARKCGLARVPVWSNTAANWPFVLACAGIVLIVGCAATANAYLSANGPLRAGLCATFFAAGIVVQFGFGYQYFLLNFQKKAVNYFGLALFLAWLVPPMLGAIMMSVDPNSPSWQCIMSASAPIGIALAFDGKHGNINQIITILATLVWITITASLLFPCLSWVTTAARISEAQRGKIPTG